MSRDIKYDGEDIDEILLPEDKPREDYDRRERWKYLLDRVRSLGHPGMLDKSKEADRLGVSRRQIYYDLQDVAAYVNEHLGEYHSFEARSVFDKAVRESLAEGDWKGAVSILKDEAEWLEARGEIDKEPDRVEMDHNVDDQVEDMLNDVF